MDIGRDLAGGGIRYCFDGGGQGGFPARGGRWRVLRASEAGRLRRRLRRLLLHGVEPGDGEGWGEGGCGAGRFCGVWTSGGCGGAVNENEVLVSPMVEVRGSTGGFAKPVEVTIPIDRTNWGGRGEVGCVLAWGGAYEKT